MRIRIVEVSAPQGAVDDGSKPVRTKKYYKLQSSWFGWIWWDQSDPEYGMIYPTFDTLEEAQRYVQRTYFEKETVVAEYKTL